MTVISSTGRASIGPRWINDNTATSARIEVTRVNSPTSIAASAAAPAQ